MKEGKMKKYLCVAPLVPLLLFTLACQKKSEVDLTPARKAIEKANQIFIDASLRGDSAAVGALLTDDTLLLPPAGRMIQGKKATEDYWRATWVQLKILDFKMTILNLYGKGDLVYEVGSYTLKFQVQGKESVDEGKYVVVWRQSANKSWRKLIDIWNSDIPTQ
jgi:ketosteroid isomerase-like protein